MPTVHSKQDVALMAHLLRRAGFGATLQELDHCLEQGYEATVEALLSPPAPDAVPEDLIRRYHVDQSDLRNHAAGAAYWIYRMVQTPAPLREKMCLFWHRVFATAATKLIQARMVASQLDMFRNHGLGSFQELLLRLSRDPAMMMWLDNQDNHKDSINENYGREILELFSMGVGNYTEDDIKECARAFTGWRVVNPDYMSIKMRNNTARPYGYIAWQFEYDDTDHDHGDKTFLGEAGIQWRGRDRHHLPAGSHAALYRPPSVPLLRRRRGARAAMAAHRAARSAGHRPDVPGLFRFRLCDLRHAAGPVQRRLLQVGGVALRPHQEPGGRWWSAPCAWPAAWNCRRPIRTPPSGRAPPWGSPR